MKYYFFEHDLSKCLNPQMHIQDTITPYACWCDPQILIGEDTVTVVHEVKDTGKRWVPVMSEGERKKMSDDMFNDEESF